MALEFPSDRRTYEGVIRFTIIRTNADGSESDGETCDLYLPVGVQIADRVEYENIGLGALGLLAGEGGTNVDFAPSDVVQDQQTRGLILSEITKKFSDRAGAVARARTKTAPNPNTRALFKQVSLRSFQFSFKFIPTSESEANTIPQIIRFFRTEMYPLSIAGGEQGSLGYKFPNKFKIQFFYDNIELATKIAPAYLEAFVTNYNPTQQAFFKSGNGNPHFSETDINMTLTEAQALDQAKILEGF